LGGKSGKNRNETQSLGGETYRKVKTFLRREVAI